MNRSWPLCLAFALATVVSEPLAAIQSFPSIELDEASEARAGIRTEPVGEASFADEVRLIGQTVRSPGSTITIKAPLEGRVHRVWVAPGDSVDQGMALVSLRSHQLLDLRGRYLAAKEARRLADLRVRSGEELLTLEGISRIALEERRQAALAAHLELDSILAELEHLGLVGTEREEFLSGGEAHPVLTLRAPAAGVLLDLEAEAHGWVEPYQRLLVIGDPERLELELQVPPDQALGISPGDQVVFEPVGRPGQERRAKILTQVPRVDPRTRTVTLRAEILAGSGQVLPGLFVEGSLARGAASRSTSVPEAAVIRVGDDDCVFIRTGPRIYQARTLRVGRFDGTAYEILAGIEVGEEVVVEGVFLLKSALARQQSEAE